MKVIACLALAVCSAVPLSAGAGVIDFEDLADPSFLEFSSLVSRGYLVSHDGSGIDPFAEVVGTASEDALKFSGNGSKRLVTANTSTITISRPGGGAFDLLQFVGGESWLDTPHVWARPIPVVGQLIKHPVGARVHLQQPVESPPCLVEDVRHLVAARQPIGHMFIPKYFREIPVGGKEVICRIGRCH